MNVPALLTGSARVAMYGAVFLAGYALGDSRYRINMAQEAGFFAVLLALASIGLYLAADFIKEDTGDE